MERFFPSEIARLVLGFLQEVNCTKTWESFMTECPYLQEYYQFYKKGEVYSTNVGGKSLSEILHEYCKLKAEARHGSTSQNQSFETNANVSDSQIFKTPRKTTTQHQLSSTRYPDAACFKTQVPSSSRSAESRSFSGSLHASNRSLPIFSSPASSPSVRKSCRSASSRKLHFAKTQADKDRGSHLYTNQSPKTVGSDDESVVILDSYLHGEQDMDSSYVCSASGTALASDNLSHSNVTSPRSSVYEAVGSEVHHSVGRSVVLQSREVAAGDNSIVCTTSSLSLTPRHTVVPPSYHRAPATNSPRIILSYDRSQVASFTTPLKKGSAEFFISPRRKSIPRRRLLNDSPLPEAAMNELHDDLESILQEFFSQQPIAQKIADNINKIKGDQFDDPEAANSTNCAASQDACALGKPSSTTLTETENAPVPHSSISMDSDRNRDDMNSIREPASFPSEISGHVKGLDTSVSGISLTATENLPVTSASEKEKSPPRPSPDDTTEVDSRNRIAEVHSAAPTASGSEETPMDCDRSNELVGSQIIEEPQPTENSAEESVPAAGLNKSRIKEVSIGTPFNIETQMITAPSIASESTPNLNKSVPMSTTDPSFSSGVSVSSTPLNVGVSNPGVTANLITLPNGNFSIIPTMQTPFYQTVPSPALMQLSYPNLGASYVMPSTAGPVQGSIQYRIVVPGLNCQESSNSGVTPVAFGGVQTIPPSTIESASMPSLSPFKIPADYSPTKSLLAGSILQNNNVGSFVTVSSKKNTKKKKKTNAFDVSVSPLPQNTTATDIVAGSESLKEGSSSHPAQETEQVSSQPKKNVRKKKSHRLRPLFPSPSGEDVPGAKDSQNEPEPNFPVLSIPEPSPSQNESLSAYEMLQKIAGYPSSAKKSQQSPILKTLISSAKQWSGDGGILSTSCVRTLDFGPVDKMLNTETVSTPESPNSECRKSSRLMQKKGFELPVKAPKDTANDLGSEQPETNKSRSRSRSSNRSIQSVTDADHQPRESLRNVITTIEDVISYANEDYSGKTLQASKNQSGTPCKKKKRLSPKKSSKESETLLRNENVSKSPGKKKATPKKPVAEPKVLSREEYFPASDSDSSNDDLPLSTLLAAKKITALKDDNTKSPQRKSSEVSAGNPSDKIPDFESTNEKPSELDDDYVPSKNELQLVSEATATRTTRSTSKSKRNENSSKRSVVPKLPPKTKFRTSGKLQAMFRSMLHTSSREETVESEEDSSDNEISAANMLDEPSGLGTSGDNGVDTSIHLEKAVADKSAPPSPSVETFSPVKSGGKTSQKVDVKKSPPSNSAKCSAVLNMLKDRKNAKSSTVKQKKMSAKPNVGCAPQKDLKTGDIPFVPSTRALKKCSKDSGPPLNLNTFANEEVMEKLLKGHDNVIRSPQSNFEGSGKEKESTSTDAAKVLNKNVAGSTVFEPMEKTTQKVPSEKTKEVEVSPLDGQAVEKVSNPQAFPQKPVPSPHHMPRSSSFAAPQTACSSSYRVLPPPKKRIRPVPSTNQDSPFLTLTSPEGLDLSIMSQRSISPCSSETQVPAEPAPKRDTQMSLSKSKALSGKPRAMAEFYQQARPNKKDGIPISPEAISSSSCTLDTFIARCQSKATEMSENEPLNLVSPAKKMDVGVKRKLSSTSFEASWEKDLFLSPDKTVSSEPINLDKSMSKEDSSMSQEKSASNESASMLKLPEENSASVSPVKSATQESSHDSPVKKKRKLSVDSPAADFIGTDLKIVTDDSFEEGMIIDSPSKDNSEPSTSVSKTTGSLVQNLENLPVDFSSSRIENISSPVRGTLSVEQAPKPILRKKFELNPKFPAGVKFPRDWNNSKLSHYSKSIEKNAEVADCQKNDLLHSKETRARRKSKVNFNTPEKRHSFDHKRYHSHSSSRRPSESRFSDSRFSSSRSRYDYSRSFYKRSPCKRRISNFKSARPSYHRRDAHAETSEDRSVYPKHSSPDTEKPLKKRFSSNHVDAKYSFHSPKPSETKDKNLNKEKSKKCELQETKKDTVGGPSKIKDLVSKHVKPDAEMRVHSKVKMNPKATEKQESGEKSCSNFRSKKTDSSKKSLDKKGVLCANEVVQKNPVEDSLNISKSPEKLTSLSSNKKSSNVKPDTEMEVHPEVKTNTKVAEKQKTGEKSCSNSKDNKTDSSKKIFDKEGAGDKEVQNNQLENSIKMSKSPDKTTSLSPNKRSRKGCKKYSSKPKKLVPSKSNFTPLEKEAMVQKVLKHIQTLQDASEVDKSCKTNKSEETPIEGALSGENKTFNAKTRDSDDSKKKDESPEISKLGKKSSIATKELTSTKSLPNKKSSNVSSPQTTLTNYSLSREKTLSPICNSADLKQSAKSNCQLNNLPSSSIENRETSICRSSNSSELWKTKEQISITTNPKASEIFLENQKNKCTSFVNKEQKNVSCLMDVAPNVSEIKESEGNEHIFNVLEKESQKTIASELEKTKKPCSDVDAGPLPVVLEKSSNINTDNVSQTSNILTPGTSHQKKHSRKVSPRSSSSKGRRELCKKNPKRKVKKQSPNNTINELPETRQTSSNPDDQSNTSEPSAKSSVLPEEADLQLSSSRTSADQHELEEAVASISARFISQDTTPRKNEGSGQTGASSASGEPELSNLEQEIPSSDLACSESKNEETERNKEAEKAKILALFTRIQEYGVDNILDAIRHKT